MRRIRSVLSLARCERGAAAVEFAIVSGVLIMLLIGIIELGRAFYVQNHISHLADQAARRVLIQPNITDAELEGQLRSAFNAGNPDDLAISVDVDASGGNDYRVVTIGFPLTLFIPNLSSGAVSLSVTRRIPTG